jgi:predicted transcriptional regulator YheO
MVDFLAEVLGKDAEIVLHDVLDIDKSIVAIRNSHISGREVGSPATNLVLRILKDGKPDDRDFLSNYRGLSASGKALKSSTFFIRDEKRRVVGLLCVNVDNEKFVQFRSYLDAIIQLPEEADGERTVERFSRTVESLSSDSIENVIGEVGIAPERMSPEEKMDIVKRLSDEGVFLLKGSVGKVASRLKVSEATAYRYLNTVKKDS